MADDDDTPGVEVRRASGTDKHDNATAIRVENGHLHVGTGTATARDVVAIYAPGMWLSAKVVGA